MPNEAVSAQPEESVGFAAGSRQRLPAARANVRLIGAAGAATADAETAIEPTSSADAGVHSPELDSIKADLDQLEDSVSRSIPEWMALTQRVEALFTGTPTGTPLAVAVHDLRQRVIAVTTATFDVARFPETVTATRQLVAAAEAVFTGQPDAKAWPSCVGRTVSADTVAADYEVITKSMREYGAKIASLDEAIKNARDNDVLWLLPDGGLRCPIGVIDILREEAATANLITSAADQAGATRLLGALAMFSTPGRSQETLSSLTAPFRSEVIAIAREAHTQLKILHQEGAKGAAEAALASRPFRLRGVEIRDQGSVTYVLMIALWIASGAVTAALVRTVPQYVMLPSAAAMFLLSTLAAFQPARSMKRDAWDSAVEAATDAVQVLQEALQVRKKAGASRDTAARGDRKPGKPANETERPGKSSPAATPGGPRSGADTGKADPA